MTKMEVNIVEKTRKILEKKYKLDKKVSLVQDQDVLDTWFSSSLWTFATLGWPQQTKRLDKYHPTSLLVTGFDIIFLGCPDDNDD